MVSLIKQISKLLVMSHCSSFSGFLAFTPQYNPSDQQPPVKEDAADIIMGDGWFLRAGCHAKRPQEVVDQDVELLDIFGFCLQHAKHHLVPLPHAFSMG